MNRVFALLAATLALGGTACQKTEALPQGQGLVGEWNWVQSRGGLTGNQTYTPASTGTTIRWVFRADSTVQVSTTRQGVTQPMQMGTYSLGVAKSIYSGQPARALTIRLKQAQTYILSELSSNRLVVDDNAYDGFGDTYERL
ncbi:hypothetical protein HHL22_21215 [Hymenobacter sp. RP-2-7]|uniref:Lipocalin-like domain-containing protein n=1 Tax=Hymenobacter polaris TaxID=2682546 RepID=A0A7Y0AHZ7_9BACT|nr:hypothetical protein [Hymenobacter polaris]NML67729.1 hypothetical protein [Hymenobacter polaris]